MGLSCHQKKVQLFGALLTETILYPVPHCHFTLGDPTLRTDTNETGRSRIRSGLFRYLYIMNCYGINGIILRTGAYSEPDSHIVQ